MLREVFAFWRESHKLLHRKEYRRDFVFHMTDWLNDLEKLNGLFAHPNHFTKKEAAQIVFGFFIHALPHLKAASRILLDDIGDAFEGLYNPEDQKVEHTRVGAKSSTSVLP
jgi:hypothetical protein